MPTIPGAPLVLPEYVDTEVVTQEEVVLGTLAIGAQPVLVTPGDVIRVPVSVHFVYVSSATAGTRTIFVAIQDSNALTVYGAFSPITQGPSLTMAYQFDVSIGTAYGVTNQFAAAGLPMMAIPPTWRYVLGAINIQGDDQFQGVAIISQRFATGQTGGVAPDTTPVPTPLLL